MPAEFERQRESSEDDPEENVSIFEEISRQCNSASAGSDQHDQRLPRYRDFLSEGYEKAKEAWKPENFAKVISENLQRNGLDENTMAMLRSRQANGDLDKTLEHLNNDPELKKQGISLKLSEDGQSVVLQKDGKEMQRDFVKGPGEKPPELSKEEMEKLADEVAEDILASGTLSDKSKDALRKYSKWSGIGTTAADDLVDKVNRRLEAQGYQLDKRESPLQEGPKNPYGPIRSYGWTNQLNYDLRKDGQTQSSVYLGHYSIRSC